VTVAGVDLPVTKIIEGVGRCPGSATDFKKHATVVQLSCPAEAGFGTDVRMQSEPSRIDALLHGTLAVTIHKLLRVQNNAARIVLQAPRRFDAKPLLR